MHIHIYIFFGPATNNIIGAYENVPVVSFLAKGDSVTARVNTAASTESYFVSIIFSFYFGL